MRKPERVRELLARELGTLIHRELDVAPSVFITVTEVALDEDFLHAAVRVSIWPDSQRSAAFRELKTKAGALRGLLGKRLPDFHPLPYLEFELDERVAEAARVEELTEKLKNEGYGQVAKR